VWLACEPASEPASSTTNFQHVLSSDVALEDEMLPNEPVPRRVGLRVHRQLLVPGVVLGAREVGGHRVPSPRRS